MINIFKMGSVLAVPRTMCIVQSVKLSKCTHCIRELKDNWVNTQILLIVPNRHLQFSFHYISSASRV